MINYMIIKRESDYSTERDTRKIILLSRCNKYYTFFSGLLFESYNSDCPFLLQQLQYDEGRMH